MKERVDIVRETEKVLEEPISNLGCELVACEFTTVSGRRTLQVFIDREGGVGVADCARVSDGIGDLLDVEDLIDGAYNLEVSSPGLARPLRRERDFRRFAGSEVRIRTYEPIDGRRNYRGTIVDVDAGIVTVEVDGRPYTVPVAAMERANLVYELPERTRTGKGKGKRNGQSA